MEIVAAAAHFRLRGDHSAAYNDLMPERLAAPITLAGATLDRHRHVCAFFHTPDEEYDFLMRSSSRASVAARRVSTSSVLTSGTNIATA